ncbi:hypothetical protein D3C87_1402590 [compost metagenome]
MQQQMSLLWVVVARGNLREQQIGIEYKGCAAIADLQQPRLDHHFGFAAMPLLQQQLAAQEQQPTEQRIRL